MKQHRSHSIGSRARPILLLALGILAMAPGLSHAALSLDFASPASNGDYGSNFVGTFTYGPTGPITVTVTNGTSIVPQANVRTNYGGGNGTITLIPVFGQTGQVDVLVDRNSGSDQ